MTKIEEGRWYSPSAKATARFWLHTKHRYETPIYRLPTGGIKRDEAVEEALFREIAEETGQKVEVRCFLGILDCNFVTEGSCIPFVSYIFYLDSLSMELRPTDTEEVAGYRTVPVSELGAVAQSLRRLKPARRRWGFWRSLAHDSRLQRARVRRASVAFLPFDSHIC